MELAERNDLEESILDLIGNVKPSPTGWIRVDCPSCIDAGGGKGDRKQAMGINRHGFFHCFKCGVRGQLSNLADWMDRQDFDPYAVKEPEEPISAVPPPPDFVRLWEEPYLSAKSYADARKYLLGRKISPTIWREADIGACLRGKECGRIILPIKDAAGRWIGYVGRDWTGRAERKYLYPIGMERGRILYGESALDRETRLPCLVVEGIFDTFPFIGNAVAVLGKPSAWQKQRFRSAKRPICVVLDGDAHEEGEALAMQLRLDGVEAGSVTLGAGVDPDEVDPGWLMHEARQSLVE